MLISEIIPKLHVSLTFSHFLQDFSFDNIDNLAIDDENYKTVLSINEKEYFEVENSQISKEQEINLNVLNNDNITNSIIQFRIYCEEGFTLNYVEAYGKTLGALKFRTEKKIINNKSKISQNLNIDKSLITTIKNIQLNTVKIKYLTKIFLSAMINKITHEMRWY